jgi:hypothetical protein
MQRGTIAILIIVLIAVCAGAAAVWYRYANQQRAQAYWGTQTALLIDRAPEIEVIEIGDANRGINLEADEPPPEEAPAEKAADAPTDEKNDEAAEAEKPPLPQAVEFKQVPWIILQTKDAREAKGIANLRRALVVDATYDWTAPAEETEPTWQYALAVNDGRNFATVLFDFDSRQIGLAGGSKTARLRPEANEDFKAFFAEQLPESKKQAAEKPAAEKPAAEPAEKEKAAAE